MKPPVQYDSADLTSFGGTRPEARSYADSNVVILPIPLDRTTSYLGGTRHGPHEILVASTHLELWDEEVRADVHGIGLYTLPEMELPFGDLVDVMREIERVADEVVRDRKFLVVLGGEHSITPPVVRAMVRTHPGISVLQLDAHADLRETYMGSPLNHACAMRRVLESAPCTQVGIRSLSTEEAEAVSSLRTRVFYDVERRQTPDWIDRVVDSLNQTVYITIDCDALDPAIMPAVGTPEPGGLSWYEMLALLKAVVSRRQVVGFDLVELCPIPGLVAPNFLSAKLVYKLLSYRFS